MAGFSLGTDGAWHIASVNPGRFAGLVAVSGRVPKTLEPTQLAALKNIPIQIFQGGQDQNTEATFTRIDNKLELRVNLYQPKFFGVYTFSSDVEISVGVQLLTSNF